jgi:MFS family permease
MHKVLSFARTQLDTRMLSGKQIVLVTASVSVFFEALDIAIINLAMPLIATHFGLATDTVQWLQTVYVLLYGGFLVVGGKLSDAVGKKRIFVTGSGLFLLTSLGAGLSGSFGTLLAFRAVQGVAAALLMPSALSLVTTTFPEPKERSRAVGVFSAFAAVGSGSGLSVGGLVATHLGWQWVFLLNVPVILLTLCLALACIREEPLAKRPLPDLLSGVLLTAVIAALSYLVHALPASGRNGLGTLLVAAGIGVGAWLFLQRSRRLKEPLIAFGLLRHSVTGIGVFLLLGAFFTGYLFIISLVLQQNLGYDAASAGLLLFPFSLLSAIVGKFLIPPVLKRLSLVQTAIAGMASMAVGASTLGYFLLAGGGLGWLLLSAACVNGIGIAVGFTTLTVLAVQPVPEAHHGLVSSVATTAYFFGGGLGLSLLSMGIPPDPGRNNPIGIVPVVLLAIYALLGLAWLLCHAYQSGKATPRHAKV